MVLGMVEGGPGGGDRMGLERQERAEEVKVRNYSGK